MFTIVKLVKTSRLVHGSGSHHTARDEDRTLSIIASYPTLEDAEKILRELTETDSNPASEWRKRKVYSGITCEEYLANKLNYHLRTYFLTTPSYTLADLEKELSICVQRDGISVTR